MRFILAAAAAWSLVASVAQAQPPPPNPDQNMPAQSGPPTRYFLTRLSAARIVGHRQRPAQSGPQNPAVKSMHDNNSSMPVAGANSFTMDQAKNAIQARGYTNVANLKKDKNGVWRGTATKGGQAVPVSVDYQGNVN